MQVLNILQDYGILNIAVILAIIGLISKLRTQFLDNLLNKISKKWLRWLILTLIALALSFGFTVLNFIAKFSIQEYLKQACLNWVFAWVFHDTVKNLFFNNK
jgi:hypothetical protein